MKNRQYMEIQVLKFVSIVYGGVDLFVIAVMLIDIIR
jgi:hypothetical protein